MVFFEDNGDWACNEDSRILAETLYDKGLELFKAGRKEEAEEKYRAALKEGSYLLWDEEDLPPYSTICKN